MFPTSHLKFVIFSLILVAVVLVKCRKNATEVKQKSVIDNNQPVISSQNQDEVYDLSKFGIDSKEFIPTGLKTGERAPSFEAYDESENLVNSRTLLENGPLVLQFYRGEWCPVCIRYYNRISDSLSLIKSQGATFIAVSPEAQHHTDKLKGTTGVGFPIIYDQDHKIMKNYDVMFKVDDEYYERIKSGLETDIAVHNEDDEPYLPVPATYVIDRSGIIRYVQFNYDYKKRASVRQILKALEAL